MLRVGLVLRSTEIYPVFSDVTLSIYSDTVQVEIQLLDLRRFIVSSICVHPETLPCCI